MIERPELWHVIAALAAGSFMLRFTFLAVLPALIAPMIIWPAATGGSFDLPRGLAALATLSAGLWFRSVIVSITAGATTLYLALYLFG